MNTPIVECVPNFSEARRPEVMAEIMAAITQVEGVTLLDQHSDVDHNRTVVTFVGAPAAVEEAAFAGMARAAALINLDEHRGQHPRIGATDVVPFIPISDIKMQDCVEIARRLGQRVAKELEIPVYLYEEAATSPERRDLAWHRKGEYETLKGAIETDDDRMPDFGPQKLGPAGATVVGAREFLIAFNIYLNTDNLSIAKKIAKAIRHSSGGLRYVKALGLLVEGQAQVSMNLTNYKKTPIAMAVETVRREAQRYGVGISHTELVGLIPQDALIDMAVWYGQMDLFDPDQVLERKMYALLQGDYKTGAADFDATSQFVNQLAAGTPVPGGGSASAYAGAMAAALVAMVARLTLGKEKYADVQPEMQKTLEEIELLQAVLLAAVEADSAAFEAVMAAYRLPKESLEERDHRIAAIQDATFEAAQVPFETARKSLRVLQLAVQMAALGNLSAITDAGTAAALAQAAIRGASYNVRVNCLGLKDTTRVQQFTSELHSIETRAEHFAAQLNSLLKDRGGLGLS
ncbi:MAG: glutamate formimidoyltransferase [Anaerolineales bacterium]|nr:glutamate formimidoyltransferase [Anaerolineales bacterium]